MTCSPNGAIPFRRDRRAADCRHPLLMNAEDARWPMPSAANPAHRAAVDAIAARLEKAGACLHRRRNADAGVLDAAECPPTFDGPPTGARHHRGRASRGGASCEATRRCRAGRSRSGCPRIHTADALVVLPRAADALRAAPSAHARELGALTIGISCTPGSELASRRIAIEPLTVGGHHPARRA